MPGQASFHLKKWYFDGVDAEGRALIAYSAVLHWHGVRVPYASYLYLSAPGDCRMISRLQNVAEPELSGGTIRWRDDKFSLEGIWESASPPLRLRLYEGPEGFLDWHCLQPASRCQIRLGGEKPIEGWGYVECLEMTLPPWQLGLTALRWGRFAHPDMPMVWIDWQGERTRRWIFAKDQLLAGGTVNDTVIASPEREMTLKLENPVVIEEKEKMGEVVRALTAFLPGIDRLAPLRFLRAKEIKWRSEGTLQWIGQPPLQGSVIHELVTF